MKTALIALNGDLSTLPEIKQFLDDKSTIIAADGGADLLLKHAITPDVIIGDLDSVSSDSLKTLQNSTTNIQQYPREKDYTDAELALKYAVGVGCTKIIVVGYLGTRVDHMWANLAYFATLPEDIDWEIHERDQIISSVRHKKTFQGQKGDELSLIPLTHDCKGISTHGLQYVLQAETLPFGSTRGISNVFTSATATVTLTSGVMIAVHRRS